MNHRTLIPALALSLALLNGCGAARPSKFYQLTVPSDKPVTTGPATYPITLLLGQISSSHLYKEDHIIYTSSGEAMGTYEYHRWAEPPTEMITDVLLRELRMSGRFQRVYSLRSDAHGDYILRGHLYDFREISGSGLAARVTFEFELRDVKTATPVWNRTYSHDEPVGGKDVSAVVAAMDRNVQSGLNDILSSLDQFFAAHPPAASAPTAAQ
jgi:ABC-type uncharacterized transport system auxiliary subunit